MQEQKVFTIKDVELAKAYFKPAILTHQISESAVKEMLQVLTHSLKVESSNPTTEYITVKEACSILKCTKPKIYRLINSGQIRKIKLSPGKTLLFMSDINKLILQSIEECNIADTNTFDQVCREGGNQ